MSNCATLRAVRDGDYAYVITRIDGWWGGRSMAPMLPRLFFDHFPATTVIAAAPATDEPVGFLCGLRSQRDAGVAYIHFVGVDPASRGTGLGRMLYEWFFEQATQLRCTSVSCVTSPTNAGSRAFHAAMGFTERLHVGYDGHTPDGDRIVFHRPL